MIEHRRPCVECPWVVRERGPFAFDGPAGVYYWIGRALNPENHPCHMAPQQLCEGSRRFAELEARSETDQTIRIWDGDALVETAYRLGREGRLQGQGDKRTYRGCH